MKQVKFIRYIFDLLIAIVIYLNITLKAKSLNDVETSVVILLFMILQIILYREVIARMKNNRLGIVIMIMAVTSLATLASSEKNVIENLLLIGGQGILISFFDGKDISKEYYLKILKIILGILMASTVFYIGVPEEFLRSRVKIYVLITLLSIMLLRSSRNYENKIKEKDEKIKLASILALTFLICNERVYLFIYNIMKSFLEVISNIISIVVGIIVYPFAKLLDMLIKQLPMVNEIEVQGASGGGTIEEVVNKVTKLSPGTATIIEIILIIVLIMAIYIIVMKMKDNKRIVAEDNSETIIREKIEDTAKVAKRKNKNLYKGKDNRTIVKKIFYDIQCRLNRKKLFNEGYTATEMISQLTENHSISKIYNKSKFSSLEVSDKEVDIVKNQYDNIKNKIKNRGSDK